MLFFLSVISWSALCQNDDSFDWVSIGYIGHVGHIGSKIDILMRYLYDLSLLIEISQILIIFHPLNVKIHSD